MDSNDWARIIFVILFGFSIGEIAHTFHWSGWAVLWVILACLSGAYYLASVIKDNQ